MIQSASQIDRAPFRDDKCGVSTESFHHSSRQLFHSLFDIHATLALRSKVGCCQIKFSLGCRVIYNDEQNVIMARKSDYLVDQSP